MKRIPLTTHESELSLPRAIEVATVQRIDDDGAVWIRLDGDEDVRARIGLPIDGEAPAFEPGAAVLVLPREAPIIVGTVADRLPRTDTRTIAAGRELVLECGEASIRLCRDGRIEIRGGYVETYAEGTNRIKGASVRIN